MRKLLTFLDADLAFANAGQAVVERLTLRNLANSGRWRIRLAATGGPSAIARLEQFCREHINAPAVEIIALPPKDSGALLEDVSAMYIHSMTGVSETRWLMSHNVWLSRPTLQFVHAFGLTVAEQWAWSAWWGRWKGSPPCRLVAPSEVTARRVRSIDGMVSMLGGKLPEVAVVPHGVDPAVGLIGNRERARAELKCTPESFVILSLARLSPEKLAYRQLITAFAMLRRLHAGRDLRLVLAGGISNHDRPYMAEMGKVAEQLGVAGALTVVEHASEDWKSDLLAGADLFVSPACHPQESFGVALLEAMAAGLPIVASDWNGYREVLPAAYHPYLIPTIADHESARNVEYGRLSDACVISFPGLVDGLNRMISDASLMKILRTAGRVRAETLSWRQTTDRISDIIDRLIQEQNGEIVTTAPSTYTIPLGSPVAGLATTYMAEDTLLRETGIEAEILGIGISVVEDAVLKILRGRPETRLEDLASAFQGDRLLRNRVVMQLLRSGFLTVEKSGTN